MYGPNPFREERKLTPFHSSIHRHRIVFSLSLWSVGKDLTREDSFQMDAYIRGKVLGKGSFGSAILVQSKKDGKNYVIKEIDISKMPASERESSKQEAQVRTRYSACWLIDINIHEIKTAYCPKCKPQLLMALKHPNIVRCLECFTHANKLCIVMDWCSEGQ